MHNPLPLTGVRVLDFTWVIAGPLTTKWLAAYGAEVIKVESGRNSTDMVRADGGATPRGKSGGNVSGTFANGSTDKYGITLNMGTARAQELARRLVAVSDVVVENFTPRVMPGWGLSYEELRKINPSIIAASMPGLGSTGPHAHYRGLGSYFMVRTGLDSMVGYPHRETVDLGFAFPDASCNPAHMCLAILAALHHRERTGEGQRIELRQFESTVNYLETALLDYAVNKRVQTRNGSRHDAAAPHAVYRCAGDDRWCAITVFTEQEWRALCEAAGHPEWARDPRFSTLLARKQHEDELNALVQAWTETLPAEEVMDRLQGCGVPAGVVQHAGDLMEHDPQMAARGFYVEIEHPEIGPMRHEGVPFQLRETPGRPRRPAPLLGEHNDFVLQHVLGLTEDEVNECIIEGVVM